MVVMSTDETAAAHDTTGGMMTKIPEAAAIAKLGINLYVCTVKAATTHASRALSGKLEGGIRMNDQSLLLYEQSRC